MMMPSWKKSFTTLWVAEFLAIAGFSTTTPILPLYLRQIGVVDRVSLNWWTGAINAAPAVTLALFAPIWGSLADVYGRKLMLLRAMAGGSLLAALLALTVAPWQVLAIRILQGCVTGTVAAATVLTAAIVPEDQTGYRLGLLQMGIYLGSAAGPLFGGAVSDLAGPRISFLATALLLALATVMVWRRVQEDFHPIKRGGSFFKDAMPDFSVLKASPILVSLFLVVFCVQLANSTAYPILPLVILDMAGDIPGIASLAGLIISAGSVSGALASALIGRVSGRMGYARTLVFCLGGAGLFTIFQGLARDPYTLLAFRIAAGIFIGGTMPSVNALIAVNCVKGKQGSVYGLSSAVSSSGGALGPALGAFVASGLGYPAVFYATALVLIAVALAAASGGAPVRRDHARPSAPGADEKAHDA